MKELTHKERWEAAANSKPNMHEIINVWAESGGRQSAINQISIALHLGLIRDLSAFSEPSHGSSTKEQVDEIAKDMGFESFQQFLLSAGKTPLPIELFKVWQKFDGTKTGLDALETAFRDGRLVDSKD